VCAAMIKALRAGIRCGAAAPRRQLHPPTSATRVPPGRRGRSRRNPSATEHDLAGTPALHERSPALAQDGGSSPGSGATSTTRLKQVLQFASALASLRGTTASRAEGSRVRVAHQQSLQHWVLAFSPPTCVRTINGNRILADITSDTPPWTPCHLCERESNAPPSFRASRLIR